MRIAIAGKMASGKTTVADMLVSKYGFTRVSLATPLRQLVEIHENCEPHQWSSQITPICEKIAKVCPVTHTTKDIVSAVMKCFASNPKTPGEKNRGLYQSLGTDTIRQQFGQDVWIHYLLNDLRDNIDIVLDDLRFINEFIELSKSGFKTVRIHMSEELRMKRVKKLYPNVTKEQLQHVTEVELDHIVGSFDYVIPGWTSMNLLEDIVDEMVNTMRGGTP
jgi:dephospho-CoA kinase